jgi:hypothetical protein
MTIQIVQEKVIGQSNNTGAISFSFASAVTLGNTVVVVVACSNSDAYPMAASNCFLGYELVPGTFAVWDPGNSAGINEAVDEGIFATCWVLPNCPAGNGITLSIANMEYINEIVAYEISGLGNSPIVDQFIFNSGATGNINSGETQGSTFAPEIAIGVGMALNGGAQAPSGDTTWTAVEASGETYARIGYTVATSTATKFSWVETISSGPWVSGIVSLYAAPLTGTVQPASIPTGDEGKFRFIVEEAVTGKILTRDLNVTKPKLLRALSGPCKIEFDVDYRDLSAIGIGFNPWGHWIHVEKEIYGERKIWCSGIVQPGKVDKKTGVLHLQAQGFAGYPKGIPWLENWNPLTVDPFQVVQKIWHHLQSYSNGNLGVTVYPSIAGLEMLPGYAFDGNIMNLDFFAEYIRAEDKNDCGDYINTLAQNIPFDYVEYSNWNDDYSAIQKSIFLGYPKAGVQQDYLSFVINENVMEALPYVEAQIDWASDVIIDGWFPGSEYSATFTNPLPNRYRRVLTEDEARINSNEIAAAWAQRKLSKRQTPAYWSDIVTILGHPNAPFGSYDVGDDIWVTGYMPWVGDVNQLHKILAIQVNEDQGTCELTLMAEGAFNYAPVYYQGSISGSTTMVESATPNVTVATYAAQIGPGS